MTSQAELDRHFLNYAITIGRRGLGTTAPNPSVGAVVVATRESGAAVIVGEGTTAPGGRPHAEPQALAMAGEQARGATLYVSLEPCSHHGKTPPCTDAIIASGIARVVCELPDADPRVACNGFSQIVDAGITLQQLAMTPDAVLAHAGHVRGARNERPFVTLKLAVSADGRIAAGDGAPVWITGPDARARGHLLRAQADAILVGSGTMRADDPLLTCRLPGLTDRSPRPVVLDTQLTVTPSSRLVRDGISPPMVFTKRGVADHGLDCIAVDTNEDGLLEPVPILLELKKRGVTRLLIEGGTTVGQSFMAAGPVDEIVLFRGANQLGDNGFTPFGARTLSYVTDNVDWILVNQLMLGADTMTTYRANGLIEELAGH